MSCLSLSFPLSLCLSNKYILKNGSMKETFTDNMLRKDKNELGVEGASNVNIGTRGKRIWPQETTNAGQGWGKPKE